MNRTLELPQIAGKIEHAGLFFDKYFFAKEENGKKDNEAECKFLREVERIGQSELYPVFFKRYGAALEQSGARVWQAQSLARVATGLGNASPIENGFNFHHSFGVPVLPGSGLKGLAAAFARAKIVDESGGKDARWQMGGEYYRTLFGDTDESGSVVFFDALPKPNNWKLVANVMTPHHSDYNADGKKPPADWDSPTPVPFLSASGTWQFALGGEESWTKIARTILEKALEDSGFGAKTSSGFGRFNTK